MVILSGPLNGIDALRKRLFVAGLVSWGVAFIGQSLIGCPNLVYSRLRSTLM